MSSLNGFAMATADRLPNVLSANGHVDGIRRAADSAQRLSRRNVYAARAKLMQQALTTFTGLVYERFEDDTAILANVDIDGRILIATPWSSKHYRLYGLRRVEADALRWEMHNRTDDALMDPPLFFYMADYRAWYLNLHAYADGSQAMTYLVGQPVSWRTLNGYANHSQNVRKTFSIGHAT